MFEKKVTRRVVLGGAGAALVTAGTALWLPGSAVAAPEIASCDDWGAAPPRGNLSVVGQRPDKIVIHHTATPNSDDYSRRHAYELARGIQQAHFGNGWDDTGQHFTVSRGGHIMCGRRGSLGAARDGHKVVIGAHCPGQNEQIGIENEGTYTDARMRDEHYAKLVRLCAWLCRQYDIRPGRIYGHRDFFATACPGDTLYHLLPKLRDDVRRQA
ncbi:N-acetylmuramoyl-L-alanine amidase [Herbihabitans rhizosphaerae]|uniref:N-acetylmuramoyl-L-alanine amidase n=1 Tax=Herbihabitans rhizosphaerae TaxID=1872711 RepID=A0A4V2ES05_9PSEU|nr:peptidoglycan recognition family protein [Herbihabitans rhizosphaerae]RZS34687.1 N-acetylmuramoyl-L-alanine amidase [Herbihabitans rhizosphaerae]